MRHWILPTLLLCSLNAAAMQSGDRTANTPEQRLTKCMSYLDMSFGQSQSAKVIKIGPSLRRKVPNVSIDTAVVVMDYKTNLGHTLVLRPISRASLRSAAEQSVNVWAGSLHTFELSEAEHHNFEMDSKQVGSITVTFEGHEGTKPSATLITEAISLGSILKIEKTYFAVVNKTTGTYHEQGVRPQQTNIFELAAFNRKPQAGEVSEEGLHKLEIGGFWHYELDGQQVSSPANLGRATIDIHRRVGPTADPSFSATIVDWKAENDATAKHIVPAIRIGNYQTVESGDEPSLMPARAELQQQETKN